MRFIVMHKVDAVMESGAPPDPTLVANMGELVQGSLADGVFLDGAGLHRSALRVRLSRDGGDYVVTRGPYTGTNELVRGVVMVKAPSIEGATELARRLGDIVGGADIEVGPVVEPWDIGLGERPEGELPGRFLLLEKATAEGEAQPLTAPQQRRLAAFLAELDAAGTLLMSERLAPSARGKRLRAGAGKRTWTDGPFTESKELIAGFSVLELPSIDAARAWADRYAAILGDDIEVDIRELA